MAGITKIELSKLIEAKAAAEGEIAKYKSAYLAIYEAKTTLRQSFQGKDAKKFDDQLEAFKDDFMAMEALLTAYAEELQLIHNKYVSVQNALVDAANVLSTGNA